VKYLIDLNTGGTISFESFKDDEKALLYAKSRGLSVIEEDGKIDGTITVTKEIAENILKELNENKPKKTRKNGTK